MSELIIDDIKIIIFRKKIKNLYIKIVKSNQSIQVSAPNRTSDSEIELFVKSKLSWIKKHLSKLQVLEHNKKPEINYISGEYHYYKGHKYQLNVIYNKGLNKAVVLEVAQDNHQLINLYVSRRGIESLRKKVLLSLYKELLDLYIPIYIKKWEKIIGVKVNSYRTRHMKSRWGSCNITDAVICLNLELAKFDLTCLEYVIVHELVHLLERYHNKRFYSFMDEFMPNWRDYEKILKNQSILI